MGRGGAGCGAVGALHPHKAPNGRATRPGGVGLLEGARFQPHILMHFRTQLPESSRGVVRAAHPHTRSVRAGGQQTGLNSFLPQATSVRTFESSRAQVTIRRLHVDSAIHCHPFKLSLLRT